jgi:CRISPR-associated protein Csb1
LEEALVVARNAGRINFSDVYIDLRDTDAGIDMLSATEMPHRLSDAILRDSAIDGVAFKNTDLGKAILSTTPANLSVLLEASPTTVLYGSWFSQHNLPRPLKIQRSVVADIWAENAVLGQSVGGRIDPLGIEKLELYQAANEDWTALEHEAVRDAKGKPKPFGKPPSKINHGNIPPAVREQGTTAEKIILR